MLVKRYFLTNLFVWVTIVVFSSQAHAIGDYDFPYINDFESITSVHDDATDKNANNDINGQADWELFSDWGIASAHNAWTTYQSSFHLDNNPVEIDQASDGASQVAQMLGYVNIPTTSVRPVLQYVYKLNLIHWTDTVSVKLQTEGSAGWITLKSYTRQHNRALDTLEDIDLSAYKGMNVRIAFEQSGYYGAGSRLFVVDNFSIAEADLQTLSYPYTSSFDTSAQQQWFTGGSWQVADSQSGRESYSGSHHLDNNLA
jgi:hypothetical protein